MTTAEIVNDMAAVCTHVQPVTTEAPQPELTDSVWLTSKIGGIHYRDVGEGSIYSQIGSMVGKEIPSSDPPTVHKRWKRRIEELVSLSSQLTFRLWRVTRGDSDEIDLRAGLIIYFDLLSRQYEKFPFFKRNSFLPSVFAEKIFGFKRRLEYYLAIEGIGAELLTGTLPRTTEHAKALEYLERHLMPVAKRRAAALGWDLIVWRKDHGKLQDGDESTALFAVTTNWHLHFIVVPQPGCASIDDLRADIQNHLRTHSVLPPHGSVYLHRSKKITGDAIRLSNYFCHPHTAKDYAITVDGALRDFFRMTQGIRRYNAAGKFYKAMQLPYIPCAIRATAAANGSLIEFGLKGIHKIDRFLKADRGWGYSIREKREKKKAELKGDDKDDGKPSPMRVFVAAYMSKHYSLIGSIRLRTDEAIPNLDDLLRNNHLRSLADAATSAWHARHPEGIPDHVTPASAPPWAGAIVPGKAVAVFAPPYQAQLRRFKVIGRIR